MLGSGIEGQAPFWLMGKIPLRRFKLIDASNCPINGFSAEAHPMVAVCRLQGFKKKSRIFTGRQIWVVHSTDYHEAETLRLKRDSGFVGYQQAPLHLQPYPFPRKCHASHKL